MCVVQKDCGIVDVLNDNELDYMINNTCVPPIFFLHFIFVLPLTISMLVKSSIFCMLLCVSVCNETVRCCRHTIIEQLYLNEILNTNDISFPASLTFKDWILRPSQRLQQLFSLTLINAVYYHCDFSTLLNTQDTLYIHTHSERSVYLT